MRTTERGRENWVFSRVGKQAFAVEAKTLEILRYWAQDEVPWVSKAQRSEQWDSYPRSQ